ncbi:MAG: GDYXXLXY domain-containing protein [Acidobacteriota bacterium]
MKSSRIVVFVLVALIQLAVAGGAIVEHELTLRYGEVFRFRIQPFDPVDAFRGRYVAIRFAEDRAPVADDLDIGSGKRVFVPIEVGIDGFARLGQVDVEPPSNGAYLRLRAGIIAPDEDGTRHAWVSMPSQRFYMDENLAPETERAVWGVSGGRRQASVSVRVRNGIGVIEELYIENIPVHEWLAESAETVE